MTTGSMKNVRAPRGAQELFTSSEGFVAGRVGCICVVVWRGTVVRHLFEQQRAALARVVQANPEGAGFLCVVEPTSTPPDDELRKASVRMVADHGGRLKCVGCVIEGAGFKAAVARSALSGMALLLANRETKVSFSATVHQAAQWIHRFIAEPEPEVVEATADYLRSLLP